MQEDSLEEIKAIRNLGCKIAIDDFGTGYSSLANIQRLPVDVVKIDRSFIAQLGRDPKAGSFLRGIISLVDTLKLQVVVEGVETSEQVEILNTIGCRQAQGYWFGKPQPIDIFQNMHFSSDERGVLPRRIIA